MAKSVHRLPTSIPNFLTVDEACLIKTRRSTCNVYTGGEYNIETSG
jgi:hypothetical protein